MTGYVLAIGEAKEAGPLLKATKSKSSPIGIIKLPRILIQEFLVIFPNPSLVMSKTLNIASESKFPPTSYPRPVFLVFVSIVPILIMTAFPAEQIMGVLSGQSFIYAIIVGAVLLFAARKFWFWSLTKYTSASS